MTAESPTRALQRNTSFEGAADDGIGLQPLIGEAVNEAFMPIVYGLRAVEHNSAMEPGQPGPMITPLGLQAATEREAAKWAEL